jgi:hypothetical protein
MYLRQPRITALFDATIAELEKDGIKPTARECVWLHALCTDVVMPDRSEVCEWLPPAVTLGKLTLYPLTVQARIWLDEYAAKWWPNDPMMSVLSEAWAMAHAKDSDLIASMTSKGRARLAIAIWGGRLPYTLEQIDEAILRHTSTDEYVNAESAIEPKPAEPRQWGEVLARLSAKLKVSPQELLTWTEDQVYSAAGKCGEQDGERDKNRTLEALRLGKQKVREAHATVS